MCGNCRTVVSATNTFEYYMTEESPFRDQILADRKKNAVVIGATIAFGGLLTYAYHQLSKKSLAREPLTFFDRKRRSQSLT